MTRIFCGAGFRACLTSRVDRAVNLCLQSLLVVVVLALAACYPPPAPVTLTAPPTVPPPTATVPSGLLLQDDFSDPNSGWLTMGDESGTIAYRDGALVVRNEGLGQALFTDAGLTVSDVTVEVDVEWRDGTQDNWMGVACRMQPNNDNYAFFISADGFYLVAEYSGGAAQPLDGPNPSTAIRTGAAVNHLRVECRGDSLRLWVNGTLLSEQRDGTLTEGLVGLLVDSLDGTPTEVRFDNFVAER